MIAKIRGLTTMAVISFGLGLMGCSRQPSADLIILRGLIYTMNPAMPQVEAVAVRGDRIVSAGSVEEIRKLQGPQTRLLDLRGKTVLPGLIDAHAHLNSLGRSLAELNLRGTSSPEQIREMVLARIDQTPQGEWISGRGWDQNDWERREFPTWRDLTGTEARPVYLRRVDGHAVWVNKTALDLCGVDRNTPNPAGGRIVRDQTGAPTGILVDNAIDLISRKMPISSRAERIRRLKSAIATCHAVGLVGVHDAGVDSVDLSIYEELAERNDLKLRVYAMLDDSSEAKTWLWSRLQNGPLLMPDHSLTVRSVKLYADGALGSRGASLQEPYSDDSTNRGLMTTTPDELYQITRQCLQAGFQVCTHAIGDAGNRIALDVYERVLKENPVEDHRLRIEHCQVLSLDDIGRFSALGIIPSMQPTHATSDMPWAEERLGSERIKGAYAWRKLLDSGCRIPCGSDFPVESPNPLWGIYAAVTRQDHDGKPVGGWYPEERMTILEAVRGFTLDAAYAAFAEREMGSIEVGKLADFTILNRDIFNVAPPDLLKTQVVYTIVGGEIVYSSP